MKKSELIPKRHQQISWKKLGNILEQVSDTGHKLLWNERSVCLVEFFELGKFWTQNRGFFLIGQLPITSKRHYTIFFKKLGSISNLISETYYELLGDGCMVCPVEFFKHGQFWRQNKDFVITNQVPIPRKRHQQISWKKLGNILKQISDTCHKLLWTERSVCLVQFFELGQFWRQNKDFVITNQVPIPRKRHQQISWKKLGNILKQISDTCHKLLWIEHLVCLVQFFELGQFWTQYGGFFLTSQLPIISKRHQWILWKKLSYISKLISETY